MGDRAWRKKPVSCIDFKAFVAQGAASTSKTVELVGIISATIFLSCVFAAILRNDTG